MWSRRTFLRMTGALGSFAVASKVNGLAAPKISAFLWDQYRIIVASMTSGRFPGQQFDFQGIRITPNVYTTLDEIDTFVRAMEDLLKNGVPTA